MIRFIKSKKSHPLYNRGTLYITPPQGFTHRVISYLKPQMLSPGVWLYTVVYGTVRVGSYVYARSIGTPVFPLFNLRHPRDFRWTTSRRGALYRIVPYACFLLHDPEKQKYTTTRTRTLGPDRTAAKLLLRYSTGKIKSNPPEPHFQTSATMSWCMEGAITAVALPHCSEST